MRCGRCPRPDGRGRSSLLEYPLLILLLPFDSYLHDLKVVTYCSFILQHERLNRLAVTVDPLQNPAPVREYLKSAKMTQNEIAMLAAG
ncbi:unnamed protein product [Haemonchus placei]|uniref:Histidine kinase n=1 Tax=Haemonchus placei TaxID=6290 RepID=A0A0N4W6N9_HAEPC|nr:unnamed protein product [Haemonchus placei]